MLRILIKTILSLGLAFVLYPNLTLAQNQQKLDSLTDLLARDLSQKQRVDVNNSLANLYQNYDSAKTAFYFSQALELSNTIDYIAGLSRAYDAIAWATLKSKNYKKAQELFEQSLTYALKAHSNRHLGDAYNGLGAALWYQEKADKAKASYLKSVSYRVASKDSSKLAATYNNIGNIFLDEYSLDSALLYYLHALNIQKQMSSNLRYLAGMHLNIGSVYNMQAHYDSSINHVTQALNIYQELKDTAQIDFAHLTLGKVIRKQGHYALALKHYLISLKIREEGNDLNKLSKVYNGLGVLFYEQQDYQNAIYYYRKFLKINVGLKKNTRIAAAYCNIALVKEHLQQLDSAEYYYQQCIEFGKDRPNSSILGWAYNGMGIVRQDQKRFTEAEQWINKAIGIRQHNRDERLAQSYNTLGKNYLLQQQYEAALSYYQNAALLCIELGNPLNYKDALEGLSLCYESLGQTQKALANHKLFKVISDSLINEHNTKKLTQQSMQYQFDKEKHLLELESEKHSMLQDQELKEQQYLTYAFLAGFAAVLVIAFFIYRNYKEKKQANIQLAEQNEEIIQQREEIRSQAEEIFGQNQLLTQQKETLEKSYENLQMLNIIGKDITQSLSVATVVATVHDKIKTLMDADEFGIGIFDDHKKEITFKNYFKDEKTLPTFSIPIKQSNRLAVHCLVNNQEVWLNNIQQNHTKYISDLDAYASDELLNSMICLPLVAGKAKIGILSVQSDLYNAYSQYHLSLLRNIATYTAVAIENARAYEKILELDQFKESMTGMIVHDLKNPLNAIIGLSKSKADVYATQSIHQSGRQMLNLVSNILDVYKFESTEMTLNLKDYPLQEIIQSAMQQVHYLSSEKDIRLHYNSTSSLATTADFELIERVIVNLLTNAIKYSPSASEINITAIAKDEWIQLSIADQGLGIPEEKIPLVFEKFKQADARKSGAVRSTGLGLTFCKMAIEAHGGTIQAHSIENKGSTFTFSIPLSNQDLKAKENQIETHTTRIQFNSEETLLLYPYLSRLKSIKMYEASKLNQLLHEIDAPTGNIAYWIAALKNAAFTGNSQSFTKLIEQASITHEQLNQIN